MDQSGCTACDSVTVVQLIIVLTTTVNCAVMALKVKILQLLYVQNIFTVAQLKELGHHLGEMCLFYRNVKATMT